MKPLAIELFNKEIRRFKLAINSGCPLSCRYCFIDKNANEVLPFESARKAVDLALGSPGENKKMLIYGGEPFLHFPLLKSIVSYARGQEEKLEKTLAISVATSGVLIEKAALSFLREQKVQLAVSVDGDESSHDRFRPLKSGAGSFRKISRNLPELIEVMPKTSLIALMGVHPSQADRFFENYKYVLSLGFENVNIEVIHGVPWTPENLSAFRENLERMCSYMLTSIASDRFLFLESTFRSLRPQPMGAAAALCPFHSYLEVYPSGDYSFYPFPFVDRLKERAQVSVGNVRDGFVPRYRNCSFDGGSPLCGNCLGRYYRINRLSMGDEAFALRAEISRGFVAELERAHKGAARYERYLREVARRDLLGFSQ